MNDGKPVERANVFEDRHLGESVRKRRVWGRAIKKPGLVSAGTSCYAKEKGTEGGNFWEEKRAQTNRCVASSPDTQT